MRTTENSSYIIFSNFEDKFDREGGIFYPLRGGIGGNLSLGLYKYKVRREEARLG